MRIATSPLIDESLNGWMPFLGIAWSDPAALAKAQAQIKGRNYPRKQLTAILSDYNKSIGNTKALVDIQKLINPDIGCVVTGQQLGFMGGPLYTILKGISCLLVARELNAVPIFWLATEDHDIPEIDHAYLLDALGNLEKFHLSFPHGHSVEDLLLSEKGVETISQFCSAAGMPENCWPSIKLSYAETMARMLMQLFEGTGMIFLEPRVLRTMAKPFFQRELEESYVLQKVLIETSERLLKAGRTPVLNLGEETNLFVKTESGKRKKVVRQGEKWLIGEQEFLKQEILNLLNNSPERFSPNAAARPVLQSALLPTLAYIAGPSEVRYHCQLTDYFQWHQVPMPCIVPRVSASLIPPFAADLLDKCGLQHWEAIPAHWKEIKLSLYDGEAALSEEWMQSAKTHFSNDLSLETLARYVHLGKKKLVHKVAKNRLKRHEIPNYGLHLLRNLLYPHNKLQERVLNWWNFQGQSRSNLISDCLAQISWKERNHLYLYYD